MTDQTGPAVDPVETNEPDLPGGIADMEGKPLLWADAVGTVALVAVTILASVWDGDTAELINLAVSAVLFLGGSLAFTVGFVLAAGRSREDFIHLAGLFYLTGTAPKAVRRAFLGLWYVQIATAIASVFTIQPPFGVMAPIWGIGLITWWTAAHGRFSAR